MVAILLGQFKQAFCKRSLHAASGGVVVVVRGGAAGTELPLGEPTPLGLVVPGWKPATDQKSNRDGTETTLKSQAAASIWGSGQRY
jgi:hypothetical protein